VVNFEPNDLLEQDPVAQFATTVQPWQMASVIFDKMRILHQDGG
jgi:hypothetical protein